MPNKKSNHKCNNIFCEKCHPLLHHRVDFAFASKVLCVSVVATMLAVALVGLGYQAGMMQVYTYMNSTSSHIADTDITSVQADSLVNEELPMEEISADLSDIGMTVEELEQQDPVIAVTETLYEGDQEFFNQTNTYIDPVVKDTNNVTAEVVSNNKPSFVERISANMDDEFWNQTAVMVLALGSVVASVSYLDEKHLERKEKSKKSKKSTRRKSTKSKKKSSSKKSSKSRSSSTKKKKKSSKSKKSSRSKSSKKSKSSKSKKK